MWLLLALACAPKAPPPPPAVARVDAARGAVDWDAAGAEVTDLLSRYLAIDTSNPPGDEAAAARFLADVLATEGIESELVEHAPGRASLVARLPGRGDEGALCLLSHLDVASVEAERWSKPPFSGLVEDGVIWGRGALDMKGMGALELATMLWLARLDVPLRRDVVLLALADEEVDNAGGQWAGQHAAELGCTHAINEGGVGLRDLIFEGQTVYTISVAEKGVLWAHMTAHGEPGHGSTPRPGQAPERLLRAIEQLERRLDRPRIQPAVYEALAAAGRQHGGFAGWVLRHPGLVRLLVKGRLMKNPAFRAASTNTVNLTGFVGAKAPNVVPSAVGAQLDIRLLPGTSPDAMLAELQALVGDDVSFEVLQAWEAGESPVDDPVYDAIARWAVHGRDDAAVGPILSVGFTDSIYLRAAGVRAYGFVPLAVTLEEAATMHGDDERVAVSELRDGLRTLLSIVVDVAGEADLTEN